jgi:Site-specific recombinases, DNA invertase Pin homologs
MRYGYVRVSSKEQNVDRQMTAMGDADVPIKNVFVDRFSGKDFVRPSYLRMVRRLRAYDELYIKSIDRLGRNYEEIIEQWNILTKIKNIDIVVLDFPLLNTKNHVNGITGKFIADLVLQVLSYVAQIERENTHQRQMEGITEAKKRGVKFGRPPAKLSRDFAELAHHWKHGRISLRKAANEIGISPKTFAKRARESKVS